jgi:hypothetical protein
MAIIAPSNVKRDPLQPTTPATVTTLISFPCPELSNMHVTLVYELQPVVEQTSLSLMELVGDES